MSTTKRGFTLIELLVVIAILAVLATAVVVILNPAQLIKQGRDSTRISDLAALHSALALYLSEVTTANLTTTSTCTFGTTQPEGAALSCVTNAVTLVDGTGWVSANFGSISSGSPLSRLPLDPVNDATYYYAYESVASPTNTFEINANMESTKYATGGTADVESDTKDGGSTDNFYEIGNDPGLDLF